MPFTRFEPEVHLQEDGCTYRIGIIYLHAKDISIRTSGKQTHYPIPVYTTVFLKMN
jgi:hypothetical protein